MRITTEMGTTHGVKTGVATCNPSMALRMLIAGVIMPSPKSRDAPTIPSPMRTEYVGLGPAPSFRVGSRAVRDRIPPSPWLSARITTAMYLTEMTTAA
jgi:hypothetical protein